MTTPWLEVDIKGLAQILTNKGIARVVLEPISNALDTDATHIEVWFTQERGRATLTVVDDDPDGFADLREAYTLFAPSRRRDDPTKRGRFGLGEKELIAICAQGGAISITSTTGTVHFTQSGRKKDATSRTSGTALQAEFRCNQDQAAEFRRLVRTLIVPPTVTLEFHVEPDTTERIAPRPPAHTAKISLPTVVVDADGNLTMATRRTTVDFYEPNPGERATIYELGVPVVEHDGRWDLDVQQKVPLNTSRDNVPTSYLRRLRELMLNEAHEDLGAKDMKRPWVADALAKASDEALKDYVEKVHGANAVIYDPSSPESNKRAVDEGRPLVYGRSFNADTWKRIREADILQPAGKAIPVGVPTSVEGEPPVDRAEWTTAMFALADYVGILAGHALGIDVKVEYHPAFGTAPAGHYLAWYGGRTVTFNLGRLGRKWPEKATQQEVDELLIHELAHETATDHLTDRYLDAVCRIGARLRTCPAALENRGAER